MEGDARGGPDPRDARANSPPIAAREPDAEPMGRVRQRARGAVEIRNHREARRQRFGERRNPRETERRRERQRRKGLNSAARPRPSEGVSSRSITTGSSSPRSKIVVETRRRNPRSRPAGPVRATRPPDRDGNAARATTRSR